MPRDINGNMTLPTGNPVVSGTAISSAVHNATVADLAAEIQDSLSRSGKGGMSVPFANASGSQVAPGSTFAADPTTGFWLDTTGNDYVGLSLRAVFSQVWRWAINATGMFVNGILGVSDDLNLSKVGGASVKATAGNLTLDCHTGYQTVIAVNGASKMTATSTALAVNSVPITGVTNPTNAQDVATKNYVDAAVPSTSLVAKAFGQVVCTGGGACSIYRGSNVASASYSGAELSVIFTSDMASASYAAMVCFNSNATSKTPYGTNLTYQDVHGFTITKYNQSTGSSSNWSTNDWANILVFC